MSSGTSISHEVVNKRQSVAAGGGANEAQIRQVILVAYWLNNIIIIGTILAQHWVILDQYPVLLGLDHGYRSDVAIFDFSKAFDSVPHQRLLVWYT